MPTTVTLRYGTVVLPERVVTGPLSLAGVCVAAGSPQNAWYCDLRDHLIFPGLVNAHDHLHRNNIPRLPQTRPFANSYAWMETFQPYFCTPEVARACAVPAPLRYWQGGLKNLLCGATTVAHHDGWHRALDDPHFPVRLLRHYGWSHSLGLSGPNSKLSLGPYGPPVVESFESTPSDQPWFIHLAEGTDAVAAEEPAQLDAMGCLASNTRLVHGVALTEEDIERVIACGAGVIWCPGSNIALLGRTLNPRRLFDAGRLALGTDSRLSGADDLLDELRIAAAHSDLTPFELLALVTDAGSRLLALPEVGGLEPGQAADLLIVRDCGNDPYRTLLTLKRADIRAVVRNGKPAIADPDFADWFAAGGIETVAVRLDGRPKLCARALLGPPGSAALEPGLEVER